MQFDSSLFSWGDQEINTLIGPDFCYSRGKHQQTTRYRRINCYRQDLIDRLLDHQESPTKEGSSWSPAVFKENIRGVRNAIRVDVVAFDLDKGQPFEEIKRRTGGLERVIVSTHSHGSTATRFPLSDWEKHEGDAAAFMKAKGYHASVYVGARVRVDAAGKPIVTTANGKQQITIKHPPCEKYRLIMFPVRSWERKEDADVIRYRLGLKALADKFGLMIDHACLDVARLYFESRHKPGAAYVAEHFQGEPVDPWTGVEIPQEMMRLSKAGDPREKDGLIGEFNAAFDIWSAIDEFELPYSESGSRPGRLDYHGSTSGDSAEILDGGYTLCVYSDSDPVKQHCESPTSGHGFAGSFDLVRVHKFGEMDSPADLALPVQHRPSFKAMMALAREQLRETPEEMFNDDDVEGVAEGEAKAAEGKITALPFVYVDPQLLPPREWLYGEHYIRKYLSATVAPGGLGKSSLSIVEALSMATGRDLLDEGKPCIQSRVWMHNGEDPLEETQKRIIAAMMHYGIAREKLEGQLFVTSGRNTDLIVATATRDGTTIHGPMVNGLVDEIGAKGVGVFILDPFVSCHAVSENDNPAINAVAKAWKEVAERGNCGVEVIHHMRKRNPSDKSDPDANDARGASALVDAARSTRVLARMSTEEAEKYGLGEERRRYFFLAPGKANLVPPMDKRVWRKLESVDLGNANDVYPSDRIQVVTSWAIPKASAGLWSDDIVAVQEKIRAGEWKADIRAPSWAGNAIAEALEWDIEDKENKARVKELLKEWIKEGYLKIETRKDGSRHDKKFIVAGRTPPSDFEGD